MYATVCVLSTQQCLHEGIFLCRYIEKSLASSVTHLKSRVSAKFSCSIEDKLIYSGTNIHIECINFFEKVQRKRFIIIYVLLLPLEQSFEY